MDDQEQGPLRSSFSDDPEMRALVESFVAELPERVDAVAQALSDQQPDELARLAHELRGAGAGHGFNAIRDAAHVLEGAAQQAEIDLDDMRRAVEELAACCSRAVA